MTGRTALISGGAGGIGTAVVAAFVADGWRVVAPVRAGSAGRLPAGAEAVEGDLNTGRTSRRRSRRPPRNRTPRCGRCSTWPAGSPSVAW